MTSVVTETKPEFIITPDKSATFVFSSESVSEGHPDKFCDFIAVSVLDAYLDSDPRARVACEVLCKSDTVVLGGEISSTANVDRDAIVREAIRHIGYTKDDSAFNPDNVSVLQLISTQSPDIALGVNSGTNVRKEQGAGDQGIMFGFACKETPEWMPLPISLAHRLTKGLAEDRQSGKAQWIRPDAKSQVSVLYEGNAPFAVTDVLVSTQHAPDVRPEEIAIYVRDVLAPRALGPGSMAGSGSMLIRLGALSLGDQQPIVE